ncbi:unnamed protein product [Onchocerca flexuosa]|uniref:Transposase n=1 Tax=Onchocerca flexuosa TaxID=387005 RepID=A0A183I5U7_9BILA|nr:unnamed protein product [Onchocerca flexuosa]
MMLQIKLLVSETGKIVGEARSKFRGIIKLSSLLYN